MGTAYQPLHLLTAGVGTTNVPELLLVQTTPATPTPAYFGYGFDAGTAESIYFQFIIRNYLSGNLVLTFDWYAAATTGACLWGAQLAAQTMGTDTTTVIAKAFATAQTVSASPRGTANQPATATLTITNLDSLADGDMVFMRIYRDAAAVGDTMTGDAILVTLDCSYTTP